MKDENLIVDAIRYANLKQIEIYLNEQSNELIDKFYYFDNNKLTILMAACFYKHENIVEMLFKRNYHPSVNLLGNIIFDSSSIYPEIITNVPPLWIATAMNNLNIIKILIEIGKANINYITDNHSTAFRVACFNGNLDICKYLIKHGANYNQTRIGNYTNLMVSTHWNHFHIIKYLINQLNINPNEQSDNGRTALHNAVEINSIEIVKYLLDKDVKLTKDKQTNLTPLLLSAKKLNFNIMNLFKNFCSNLEWIEANELIGAIYSSQESNNYNLDKAYQYLYEALNLRIKFNLPKIISTNLNEIFDYQQEYQTIDQLKYIYLNKNYFHIQSLLIFQRILGLNNTDYYYSLRYYGATLIDSNQFYKGLQIWIYQLNISQKYFSNFNSTQILRTFVHLFTKIKQNIKINNLFIQSLFQIINLTYQQIKQKHENINFNIHTLLYLITILATILEEDILLFNSYPHLYKLIKTIIESNHIKTTDSNSTLLHLSVNTQTEQDFIYKYPCFKTINFLIKFGINIDEMDNQRNTSLHILIKNSENCLNIFKLIDLIYHIGNSHLDYSNNLNKIPIEMTNNIQIIKYLKEKNKIYKLKCLCAKFIKIKQISFKYYFNKSILQFINNH